MKKLVLKYLPIPLALILAVLCSFTLSSYNKNRSEYAIVSYESNAVSFDLTVSNTGIVVKVMPTDLENQEKLKELDLDGKHISDAVHELSLLAEEGETVFVGAYIHEDAKVEAKEMKSIVEEAASKLEIAFFSSYGTYEAFDLQRALAYKKTIGKVTCVKFFADTIYEEISLYIDSYRLYEINPYDLGAYVEYISEKNEFKDKETLFRCDSSNIAEEKDRLDSESAQGIALAHIRNVYDEDPEFFSYSGYSIDYGYLAHTFDFRYNGENREVQVNTKTGEALETFLDDY